MPSLVRNLVIVGGGTAGWLTAGVIAARHKARIAAGSFSVTLIESPNTPIIGVGEGKPKVQATIRFAEDESIENVAIGDSNAWQVTPNKRANLLFVKPLLTRVSTNMTVVIDKRTYLFDLVASPAAQPCSACRIGARHAQSARAALADHTGARPYMDQARAHTGRREPARHEAATGEAGLRSDQRAGGPHGQY